MTEQKRCSTDFLDGKLIGLQQKLPNGNFMDAYRGVPYAEPPVGDLRFMLPVALEKLPETELDCSTERDACIQIDFITNEKLGTEDCLYLNVYKPTTTNPTDKFPVMVFIHGGGFSSGSGDSSLYSPEYLVQENVVIVTCNYRLGAFGFLYLPEAGIHGNIGLYDQVAVLQWINEYISKFNGDPTNVTIFGQSAGSVSTHIHFLSQLSRKYFHKVICQSGMISNDWVLDNTQEIKSRKIAELLGCQSKDDNEILKFLKNAGVEELFEKSNLVQTEDEIIRGLPFAFKPVVERNRHDGVLPKYPSETNKLDELNIPIMLGHTSRESIIVIKFKQNALDLKESIPMQLKIKIDDTNAVDSIVNEIKGFYFGDNEIEIEGVINFLSDTINTNGFHMDMEHLKRFQGNSSKIYAYQFSFDGELNEFKKMFNMEHIHGAAHGDDLFYLFTYDKIKIVEPSSPSYKMRALMCKLWTDFAKYGNPTPTSDSTTMKWEPIDNNCLEFENQYLNLSDDSKMMHDPNYKNYQFWKTIYRKFNGTDVEPKFL